MIRANPHYNKLQSSYLFSTISKKVQEFQINRPDAQIIRLGIGDVTRALTPSVIAAFHAGVDEMGTDASFRGYGPEQGYDFLRHLIAETDFRSHGCEIYDDEIFVSDGAKCDTGNFQELFSLDTLIAVPDPVYPVYVDTNVMAGRTGNFLDGRYQGLHYLECRADNGFVPRPPTYPVDLIYLCFPNNPTGAVASREELAAWVNYARTHQALILFDAAYEEFIRDPAIPRSIYEIEGAREVAVEFRSLSKTAGFTGTRLGYTVIPRDVKVLDADGKLIALKDLWNRRQTTKFNGVSYPVQKAAAAVYSAQGQAEIHSLSDYYLRNASLVLETMKSLGFECSGGINSPYIWMNTGEDSWNFFDTLLQKAAVVCTPGSGFGSCGQGYIRISAFNHYERVQEAMERLRAIF